MEIISENINLISVILVAMASGSFITMASYRLAVRGEKPLKLLLSPSCCAKCGGTLKIKNLVPIFSWIFQRGKCSFCKEKISVRYPVIEFCCVTFFVYAFYHFDQQISVKFILTVLIFMTLFVMIITDLEHYFISDFNQIILFILAALYHFFVTFDSGNDAGRFLYFLFSGFVFFAFGLVLHFVFKYFTNQDGLGRDDIKFFAVVGFMVGLDKFALFMFLSGMMGILFGLIWQKVKNDCTFPFAPALVLSLIVTLLVDFDRLQIFLNNVLI